MLHLQRRGTAAHGHHLDGILANDQDSGIGRNGQHPATFFGGIVLQQNDTLLRHVACGLVVRLRAHRTIRTLAVHVGAEHQAQHTAHLLVKFLSGVLALGQQFPVWRSKVIIIVSIGGAHRKTVCPCSELKVKTVGDSLLGVMCTAPVANHHTVEAPLLLQYLVQQYVVVTVMLVLIEIIGTHYSPCLALLHGSLEGREIDFAKGAVAHYNVHLMAMLLVIVQSIVLHTSSNALALKTLNVRNHHTGSEPRVFAHILEVAAVQRGAVDIDTRSQHHIFIAV